jgi:hypothetical protein
MILNTSKGRRWTLMLGAAAVAAATLGVATPAQAYWRHGGWGGWGWGPGIGIGIGFAPYGYGYGYGYPGYVYAPPVAYAPPPPYYPPSTYYSRTSITNTTTTHHSSVKHHVSHRTAPSCSCADSHANETLNSDGSYTPNAVQQTNPSAPPSSPAQDGPPPKY